MATMESASLQRGDYQHRRLWFVGLCASVALVSCGTSAFTVEGASNGVNTYLVVSGNADDVAQLKILYASGGNGGTIVDGDHHSGELICEHDTARNGHKLHFALYGGTISVQQCQQIFASFP
jgi:hypothetical protein